MALRTNVQSFSSRVSKWEGEEQAKTSLGSYRGFTIAELVDADLYQLSHCSHHLFYGLKEMMLLSNSSSIRTPGGGRCTLGL